MHFLITKAGQCILRSTSRIQSTSSHHISINFTLISSSHLCSSLSSHLLSSRFRPKSCTYSTCAPSHRIPRPSQPCIIRLHPPHPAISLSCMFSFLCLVPSFGLSTASCLDSCVSCNKLSKHLMTADRKRWTRD